MLQGYLLGMLENFMAKGYNSDAQAAAIPAPPVVHITPAAKNEIRYTAPPTMNAMPFVIDEVYHPDPPTSESVGFYDRLDDFQDQFIKIQK